VYSPFELIESQSPKPLEGEMAVSIEITRPDDLLRLRIQGRNLRVDTSGDDGAALVVEDAGLDAFLLVHFAPQAIAEGAYYEATIVSVGPDVPPAPNGKPQPPPTTIEAPGEPGDVPVRIAQGSRLVFRVPPDARIPLTIEALLDWSGLEPSVNGIAAIGPDPTPAEIAAAPAIARPADTETALELPYRLVVSPTAGVRWGHRLSPFTSRGRTELWHTRLLWPGEDGTEELTPRNPASLRAIWSDDYATVLGLNPDEDDPQLGRAAMTPNDRHQIVVKTSAFHGYEGEVTIKLGGFSAGDGVLQGNNAVADIGDELQSAAQDARLLSGLGRRGKVDAALSPISGAGFELKYWRPFVPQPFYADQVILSSLGGWLRSRGNWPLVRKAKPDFRFEALDLTDIIRRVGRRPGMVDGPPADGLPRQVPGLFVPNAPIGLHVLQPAPDETAYLDLSEWVHVATQGRDHYVRIVYEGELLPFRNRAALVKVTERKFKEHKGLIVAHMYQRYFIVVREPEKTFAVTDRGMPFKKVRLTTLVTPDIASPAVDPVGSRSFWVEVMTSTTTRARFPFLAVGTDVGGNEIPIAIPMMFLSQAAQDAVRAEVIDNYNDSSTIKAMADRSAFVPGYKILFAERDGAAPTDNSLLVTRTLTFALHDGNTRLLKAEVNVPQVQELLGTNAPTTIRLYPGYVDGGLDAGTGVFAEIVKETPAAGDPFAAVAPTTLGVGFSSDQAGGFATPNLGVSTLSRRLGPLAGKVADAVTDTFDPQTFFPAGTAALFGTFDLFKLLLGSALGDGAPKLQTQSQDIPGGKLLIATFDWEPQVDDLDLGIAAFKKSDNTKLVVHGRIEKPMTLDALGAPVAADVKSVFEGTLNDFTVTVLKVVTVNFVEFGFVTKSGAKPDVKVKLDPGTPLAFTGDLSFVEELRKAIPPDLFGDGPSLDISPTGVRAGFSFTLPPVAVGVFALRDVSLGAALTLPFLDGRPSLDFNVSERAHPFLLSVAIFGGGGFFHLQLDTAGLKLVEAAFEFGATASVDLGVASGGVHIMAGIYFKLERKEPGTDLAPTLTGYLRMGGYLSVLGLIKISLEFTLSFTYDGGRDKAYGRATLTVQVEVVFFSVSVEITVEKAFGGSSGDPTFGQLFPVSETWSEYALAFA
jgi:hypothetical protein